MLSILRKAIRLDVVELLPEVSDRHLLDDRYIRPQQGWDRLWHRSRLARIAMFFRRMATTFGPVSGDIPRPAKAILLAGFTVNQVRALEPIARCLDDRGIATCSIDAAKKGSPFQWLARRSFLWAILFFPLVVMRMFATRGYEWQSFKWAFDKYWQAYGAYVAVRRWFRDNRPRALVVSNDHSFWPRVLVAAAKDEGIPTVYLQHAPVTDRFPSLAMDYALLDGRHSLELYAKIGNTSGQAYLVGMPRMDAYISNVNESTSARTVGFCLGQADLIDRATQLLRHLTEHCHDMRFVVRLHPRSPAATVARWQSLAHELDAEFSDSCTEEPYAFLSRVDVVIAGGSGIILEAALMNVTPIMFALTPDRPDWYGFARDGLCPLVSTPEAMAELLNQLRNQRPSVRGYAKKYCATIDTPYAGCAAELATDVIQHIADGNVPEAHPWQRIPKSSSPAAFELAPGV